MLHKFDDVSYFVVAAEEEETRLQLCSFLCSLIENEIFSASLATTFFSDFFEFISSGGRRQLTEEIYKRIRTLVIRFVHFNFKLRFCLIVTFPHSYTTHLSIDAPSFGEIFICENCGCNATLLFF